MKHIFIVLCFFNFSCAHVSLPNYIDSKICNQKKNIPLLVEFSEKIRNENEYAIKSQLDYEDMNIKNLQLTNCFSEVKKIDNSDKVHHFFKITIESDFTDEFFHDKINPALAIFTLGILPGWTSTKTKITFVELIDNREIYTNKSEHKIKNFVSIFLLPIAIYRSVGAPNNLSAIRDFDYIRINSQAFRSLISDYLEKNESLSTP